MTKQLLSEVSTAFIHDLADVQSKHVGRDTRIWQFSIVLPGAVIGDECNICSHCFIENDVVIGDRVTIKNGVQLWDGLRINDDVFIGPNAAFTNDRFPRSGRHLDKPVETIIHAGASIGAGAVILPGVVIGDRAMVGAGAVLTRSVPPNAIVVGNPARVIGYVDAPKSVSNSASADSRNAAKTELGVTQTSVAGVTLHRFPYITDVRGGLTVGEFERTVPFTPKRYFMVLDVPSIETRGEHAHRLCHQFLICVRGSCAVVADDGKNRQEFILNRQDIGLHLPPMTWGIQYKYSKDAVLLVFASHYYDSADYIREYSEFRQLTGVKP